MAKFNEYANKYKTVRMERKNGILLMTLHTNGGTLQWADLPYVEFPRAFADIGSDPENKVVIMTGAGDAFSGPHATPSIRPKKTVRGWYKEYWGGKRILMNLLDIEVPMIAAINGPALRHCEIPLLCDIVLGSESVVFQDTAHYNNGLVPGDGMHIMMPLLLGMNRGRYFLYTGQAIAAKQALELGMISEVLPQKDLLPRAWTLAKELAKRPPLVSRFTRAILTQHLKRMIHDSLGYGLALEGMAVVDGWENADPSEIELDEPRKS